MSLIHVLADVPQSAIEKLFNQNVFDETSDTDITHTSMSYELKLPRQDDRGPTARNIIPRIFVRTLKDLYSTAKADYSPSACIKISELYSAGLGLPLDKRLAAFWNCYAFGSKPEYGGNEVEYADLLYVLKEHIKQSIAKSPDGLFTYMRHVHDHFDRFSSKYVVNNTNIESAIKQYGSKKVFAGPNIEGRDTVLVYKVQSKGHYKLYGAFIDRDGDGKKMIPFLKQAANCNSIPQTLSPDVMPYIGTYVIVLGKTAIPAKSVKELAEHRREQTESELFSAWFDQDLSKHSECMYGKTSEQVEAERFLNKKSQTIESAKDLISKVDRADKRGRKVKKSNRQKYENAKTFLKSVDRFQKIVNEREKQKTHWRKHANIGKHVQFFGFDMLIDDGIKGTRFVRVAFVNMQRQFKRIGISPIPMVEVKVGSLKTLSNRANADVKKVKGVKHDGVIIRACDNKTVNQALERLWYKL